MIWHQPYIVPAKGVIDAYKDLMDRKQCLVVVQHVGKRWFIRRFWINHFGGGKTHNYILPAGDDSFARTGRFVITLADWKKILARSENLSDAVATVDVHEWRYEASGGPLRYHELPVLCPGVRVELVKPAEPITDPLTVVVQTGKGQRFVVYYDQLTLLDP